MIALTDSNASDFNKSSVQAVPVVGLPNFSICFLYRINGPQRPFSMDMEASGHVV